LLESKYLDLQRTLQGVRFKGEIPKSVFTSHATFDSEGREDSEGLIKKGFEEFEKHMLFKLNEEKIRVNDVINQQGEITIKMHEEFRIRMAELESMQTRLLAGIDVLDIRTKGAVAP